MANLTNTINKLLTGHLIGGAVFQAEFIGHNNIAEV